MIVADVGLKYKYSTFLVYTVIEKIIFLFL